MVRAAASAHHLQTGHDCAQHCVPGGEVVGVSVVQLGHHVEFSVAQLRRVGPETTNPRCPRRIAHRHVVEVRRVSAVDHVVLRVGTGGSVDCGDGFVEPHRRRQPAIGFERERDHHREPGCLRGVSNADGFVDVAEGESGNELGPSRRHPVDLERVVVGRLSGAHGGVDAVPVTAGSNNTAEDARAAARPIGLNACDQFDRQVDVAGELGPVVAQGGGPVRVRPPGGSVEFETHFVLGGDVDKAAVVVEQQLSARFVRHQRIGRKARKVDAVLEQQPRFETAVGDDGGVGGEDVRAVRCHVSSQPHRRPS